MNAFPAEVIPPRQVVVWKHASQIGILPVVRQDDLSGVVHFYISFLVIHQVRRSVEVSECSAFLQDVLDLAESLDIQLRDIEILARDRILGIACEFADLVLVPAECEVAVPCESVPGVVVAHARLHSSVPHISCLEIDGRVA